MESKGTHFRTMPPIVFKAPKTVHLKTPRFSIPHRTEADFKLGKSMVTTRSTTFETRNLERLRNAVRLKSGRRKELRMNVFATFPKTRKPDGTKMGQGRGDINHFVARVPAGTAVLHLPQTSPYTDFGLAPNFFHFRFSAAASHANFKFRSTNNVFAMDRLPEIQKAKAARDARMKEEASNWWTHSYKQPSKV